MIPPNYSHRQKEDATSLRFSVQIKSTAARIFLRFQPSKQKLKRQLALRVEVKLVSEHQIREFFFLSNSH